jgi:hypothetical protein
VSDANLEGLRDAIQALLFAATHPDPASTAEVKAAWETVERLTADPISVPGEDPAAWTHRLSLAAWRVADFALKGAVGDRPIADMKHLQECQNILRVLQRRHRLERAIFPTPEDEVRYRVHAASRVADIRERLAHVPELLAQFDLAGAGPPAVRLAEIAALITSTGPSGVTDKPPSPSRLKANRRSGRPPDANPQVDQQIAAAWRSKAYKTYADLAIALHMKEREVRLALDRERWRHRNRSK